MSHANARLTVHGRAEVVRRVVEQGRRPVAHVAKELNVSRATGYKWVRRWRAEAPAGLDDRPSRAHHLPRKTPAQIEQQILRLRRERKPGPARPGPDRIGSDRIGPLVGMATSTTHAVLCAGTGCTGWPGSTALQENGSAATSGTIPVNWCTWTRTWTWTWTWKAWRHPPWRRLARARTRLSPTTDRSR